MSEPTLFSTETQPAPPPPPHWAGSPVPTADPPTPPTPVPPAPRRVLLAALMTGIVAERAASAAGVGINWTIAILVAVAGIALVQRRPGRTAVGLLVMVSLTAAGLAWRSSAWLVLPNALLTVLGLGIAATFVVGGREASSFWSTGLAAQFTRSLTWVEDAFAAPGWVIASLRALRLSRESPADHPDTTNEVWGPRLIGATIAVPIVVVLALLLADADERFATLADPSWWGSPTWSVVLVTCFAWLALALFRAASRPIDAPVPISATASFGSGNVVLGSMAATFAVFAASRLVSVKTLGDRIATTRGVTWSSEARSGFFQLLAVAGITLVVVLLARVWCGAGPDRSRRTQTALIIGNCLLVLVVVGAAIAQLLAYRDQYGWTMLRLATTATAWWLGLVFLIIAVAVLRGRDRSRWLTGAVILSAIVGLGIANAANPASFVAASNLERSAAGSRTELDVNYLVTDLGDDALPAVADAFDSLTADEQTAVRGQVCPPRDRDGWWTYHWSRRQADRAAQRICS